MSDRPHTQWERIFHPRGVAVLGATNSEGNFGHMFTQGLLSMDMERVYPVNPRGEEVLGLRAYRSLSDIPEPLDLAIIVIPREGVLDAVRECAAKGLAGVIIFTAGFGEQDERGRHVEQEMVAVGRGAGMRIIGPNCQGIYCPAGGLTVTPGLSRQSGPVGLISHSGSLTGFIARAALARGMHFSKAVSCGNECDLNAADLLEYFGDDPETKIIIGYIEGIREGRRFLDLARRIAPEKPIILWKGGITERGGRAAASHTGALAGSASTWQALTAQTGIVPVGNAEELVDTLMAFYYVPPRPCYRVVIVSGPGGPAVACTDACAQAGLEVAEISPAAKARIAEVIPAVGTSTDNPIDLGMASGRNPRWYRHVIEVLGQETGVDIFLIVGGTRPPLSRMLVDDLKCIGKPAVMVGLASLPGPSEENDFLLAQGFPIYADGHRAAAALGRLAAWARLAA